jgi:hypothetical protein
MTEVRSQPAASPRLASGPGWGGVLALIFLFIFGARLWMVEQYGASLPLIDEWEATGAEILAPWHDGKLSLSALFQAHNGDHRILATRLLEIACFELNGSWDPKLILTVKAGIFSLAATIFIQLFVGRIPRRRLGAAALLSFLFAFPFSWHNLIWAFQSQFDFFLLALAAGWLALINDRRGLALLAAFLSLFTLGAGPVLACSYIPFVLWRAYCRETSLRGALAFSAGAGAIALFGLSLRSGTAASLGRPAEQLVSLNSALAWPYSNMLAQLPVPRTMQLVPAILRNFPSPENSWLVALAGLIRGHPMLLFFLNAGFALAILSPTLCLGCEMYRRRSLPRELSGGLGLGCFALLMVFATALARAGQIAVAVRYLDLVCLVGFSSIVAAFALSNLRPRPWLRAWALFMAAGYLAVMIGTLGKLNHHYPAYWLANLRPYLATHDHSLLRDNQEGRWPILEDASVAQFMESLDDPAMLAILPHSLTHPDRPLGPLARLAERLRRASGPLLVALAAVLAGSAAVRRSPPFLKRTPGFLVNTVATSRFPGRSA